MSDVALINAPVRAAADLEPALEPAANAARSGVIPCAVVGVADARSTLGIWAFPGPREPRVSSDRIFFLASVTKPITAAAVMELVDEGRLDLQAPIQRYVPGFTGRGKDRVTTWHVLTHTSGIPDLDQDSLRRQRPTYSRMLERVCREELQFEPGTRYQYASDSFYLLAETIATLTGMPYQVALRRRVLEPLAMNDTTFDPRRVRSRLMGMHGIPMRNRLVEALILRFLARATMPGGGLFATAEDLLRFGRAMLPGRGTSRLGIGTGPRILSQATIDEMIRDQTVGIPEVMGDGTRRDPHYALGWGKASPNGTAPSVLGAPPETSVTVAASPSTFTHGGASGTRLWVDPERGLVFVFLTNEWGASDATMFETLAGIYRAWDAA
jgi:CubicO group peptidase (beta-lactamase class C family)